MRHRWLKGYSTEHIIIVFSLHLNTYGMGLRSAYILYYYSAETDFRRQHHLFKYKWKHNGIIARALDKSNADIRRYKLKPSNIWTCEV